MRSAIRGTVGSLPPGGIVPPARAGINDSLDAGRVWRQVRKKRGACRLPLVFPVSLRLAHTASACLACASSIPDTWIRFIRLTMPRMIETCLGATPKIRAIRVQTA